MARIPAADLETSFPKQVAIFHKPCAWNPEGVSAAVCDRQTRIPFRNTQGCCGIGCRSPRRVCKVCLLGAGEKNLVTDFDKGTCDEHKQAAVIEITHLTATERQQVLPHLAPFAVLARQIESKKAAVSTGELVEEFDPENYLGLLPRLSSREFAMLELLATGLDNHQIAKELGIGTVAVIGHIGTMNTKLSLKSIATTKRRSSLIAIARCWKERKV